MTTWIACAVCLVAVILVWIWGREKPRAKWTGAQITLFVFLILANIIDILQTYFAVVLMGIAVEINPILERGFNVIPASICKFLLLILGFVFLRIHVYKIWKLRDKDLKKGFINNIRLFVVKHHRCVVLIVLNVVYWINVIRTGVGLCVFVYNTL